MSIVKRIPSQLVDVVNNDFCFFIGYLTAPAFIDLGNLKFVTTDEPVFNHGNDDAVLDRDDDALPQNSDPPTSAPVAAAESTPVPSSASSIVTSTIAPSLSGSSGGGNRTFRFLQASNSGNNTNGFVQGSGPNGVVDIVIFHLPASCDSYGCDWSTLGVGAPDRAVEGGVSYCCTSDASYRGVCGASDVGRLIITEKFSGYRRVVSYPRSGEFITSLKQGRFEETESGTYILIMANCNDFGRDILALGSMEWRSEHGYLPGDLVGLMYFYVGLATVYLVMTLWYGCGMRVYQDSAIPIQKYILASMVLGLLELLFRALDLWVWNLRGIRSYGIVYTGEFTSWPKDFVYEVSHATEI